MSKELEALHDLYLGINVHENMIVCERSLKALKIIKECLVSEFKLFEKDREYFILFYFDEIHQLTFKLKNKEEYDLLKEVLE